MIWVVLGIMALSALLYICAPLFNQTPNVSRSDSEIEGYKNQIRDIDKAISDGVANADELEAVKTGLQRQLLRKTDAQQTSLGASSKWMLSILVIGFGLATAALYYNLGRPDLTRAGSLQKMQPPPGPSQQEMNAAAQLSPEQRAEMIQNMVDGLAARLEENPNNSEGWVRLLRSRQVLGQIETARAEVKRLKAAFPDDPEFVKRILSEAGWEDQE